MTEDEGEAPADGQSSDDTPAGRTNPLGTRLAKGTFLLLLLVWTGYLLFTAMQWTRFTNNGFPLIFGPILTGLTLIELVRLQYENFLVPPTHDDEGSDQSEAETSNVLTEVLEDETDLAHSPSTVIAIILALTVVVYYLGFIYVVPLFVFSFVYYFNGDWRTGLQAAVFTTAFVYVLFVVILDFGLWPGALNLPEPGDLLLFL